MKIRLLGVSLAGVLTLIAGAEDLLYFCGGRLFGAGRQQKVLKQAGCTMSFHNTTELAGFGGSIRKYEDKEPEKSDAITPEFKQLERYKAVTFTTLSAADMKGIFTPERVAALQTYVKNGGTFIADIRTPDQLADLLPVVFKGGEKKFSGITVTRPELPEMKELPGSWRKLTAWRPAEAKPGASVYGEVRDKKGAAAPLIAIWHYGRGRVIFCNGLWVNSSSAGSFSTWAYSEYLIRALASNAIGRPLKNSIKKITWPKALPVLDSVEYDFTELHCSLVPGGNITQEGKSFRFSSGVAMQVDEKGGVTLTFAGIDRPVRLSAPQWMTSGNPQDLNGDNNEALVDSFDLRPYPIAWKTVETELKNNVLTIVFTADQARMRWEFIPGTLDLDGRKYAGYGDRIIVDKSPILIESLMLNSVMPNGKIRRNTCYTTPRGYLETTLGIRDGEVRDTKIWQFFCSGQPFTYLYCANQGIFTEMVDYPVPCFAHFKAQSATVLEHDLRLFAGRRTPPTALPLVWHLFSPGRENGNNDYVALYQFVRRFLREKCGIKTFPQATQASFYLHNRKEKDLEKSAEIAAELNFRSVWLSYCPLQMTEITGEKAAKAMKLVAARGMEPHLWTPGGYNHKDSNEVFQKHPDWFIRKKNGDFYRYFKELPVADFNNAEFRKWFLGEIVKARKNGLARVYHDMGGEISTLVNHYPPTRSATAGLDGLILLLQEYSKMDLPCSIEGMNPLAKDQALFNPDKAYPLEGREFAYVGGMPLASVDNGQQYALFCDYFRFMMYNATINIDVDGYRRNFERLPGEMKAMKEIAAINLIFNRAHVEIEAPFVRETPFGTAWIGKNGGALFFERGVKELKLHLPPDWKVKGGTPLKNIPARSAVFLEKR